MYPQNVWFAGLLWPINVALPAFRFKITYLRLEARPKWQKFAEILTELISRYVRPDASPSTLYVVECFIITPLSRSHEVRNLKQMKSILRTRNFERRNLTSDNSNLLKSRFCCDFQKKLPYGRVFVVRRQFDVRWKVGEQVNYRGMEPGWRS